MENTEQKKPMDPKVRQALREQLTKEMVTPDGEMMKLAREFHDQNLYTLKKGVTLLMIYLRLMELKPEDKAKDENKK